MQNHFTFGAHNLGEYAPLTADYVMRLIIIKKIIGKLMEAKVRNDD